MTNSYLQCRKLQSLIEVTLDNVILPLRNQFSQCFPIPNLIALQIQDSENKTFEFIAQLISLICNTEENVANEILREFPKSESCFICLGINENIISGLIRIRGISFLELLDMQDEQVHQTFEFYGETPEEIDHVLSGLAKIRANIEYLESGRKFEQNTRSFMLAIQKIPQDVNEDEELKRLPTNDFIRSKILSKASLDNNIESQKIVPVKNQTPPSPFVKPAKVPLQVNNSQFNTFGKPIFKFPFNLHRSKSHESDLGNKILPAQKNKNSQALQKLEQLNLNNEYNLRCDIRKHSQMKSGSIEDLLQSNCNINGSRPSQAALQATTNLESSYVNSTLVLTQSGSYHKFEPDNRIRNLVRGNICSICKSRLNVKIQICIYCKVKVHKNCILSSKIIPCTSLLLSEKVRKKSDILLSPTDSVQTPKKFPMNNSTPNFPDSEVITTSGSNSSIIRSNNSSFLKPNNSFSSKQFYNFDSPIDSSLNDSNRYSSTSPTSPEYFALGMMSIDNRQPAHFMNESAFSFPEHSKTITNNKPSSYSGLNHSLNQESSYSTDDTFGISEKLFEVKNICRIDSISKKINQWNVPLEEVQFGELIGRGSFGSVYRAEWHGHVAVKRLNVVPVQEIDSNCLRAKPFEIEIANLHKCRHGNLVLFIGACMKPPNLAIITQLIHGETLYVYLHQRAPLNVSRIVNIGSQIAKGLGYLHAKQIIHRDLKSQNIFLDTQGKVLIGDYGLFNLVKLCQINEGVNYIASPNCWIYYAAPELLKALSIYQNNNTQIQIVDLPYSQKTDVFAFGSIWYEMLTNDYPFKKLSPATIIYLVCKGAKPPLKMSFPKDFKNFLIHCWCYDPEKRPDFRSIVQRLDQLPKLNRSPSYPTKPSNASSLTSSEIISSNRK